jgi:hypothetical protein
MIVPTAFGAQDDETAIAEGLLRGVRDHGFRRRLYGKEIIGLERHVIVPTRDLRLVRLHGPGLVRLRLKRIDLIDLNSKYYPYTARWSQALCDCPLKPDGLVWTSRQNDPGKAMILFGGRVAPTDLVLDGRPVSLDSGPGLDELRALCDDAGIDFDS